MGTARGLKVRCSCWIRLVHGCLQEGLLKAEAAYNASLGEASKSLPALVDRLMRVAPDVVSFACLPYLCFYFGRRVLAKPTAWISSRCTACELAGRCVIEVFVACFRAEHAGRRLGSQALSFAEARDHEVTNLQKSIPSPLAVQIVRSGPKLRLWSERDPKTRLLYSWRRAGI